eukprot:gnl/TRDRNA2_/TRDRNA2_40980_c0_seq1.p1 gnl/TRDRNA2_/TRDRNA2_40980_c0~~gnl/TRDRNA2_/TRDRNA2_40980_c0_seq1.p1  ORF type:complete len:421 (+),score=55.47 gnl/TRDRNA2_/TRDRNA2_40980_c0_seq1:72-1265(+)
MPLSRGLTPLTICMKRNWPEGVRLLLCIGRVVLPFPTHSPFSMAPEINQDTTIGVGMRSEQFGGTVYSMAAEGVDIEGFPPLFIGVIYHSIDASAALIAYLLEPGTCVRVAAPEGPEQTTVFTKMASATVAGSSISSPTVAVDSDSCRDHLWPGPVYLRAMLSARFESHQHFRLPSFGCGSGHARFWSRNPHVVAAWHGTSSGKQRDRWTMLELEVRRPDVSIEFVRLLVDHGSPLTTPEVQELLHLVATKERAVEILLPAVSATTGRAAEADDLECIVRYVSGEEAARVVLQPDAPLAALKSEVQAISGIAKNRQRLLWKDVVLEDDSLLLRNVFVDPACRAELQLIVCGEDDDQAERLRELHAEVGWFGVTTSPAGLAELAALRALLESCLHPPR